MKPADRTSRRKSSRRLRPGAMALAATGFDSLFPLAVALSASADDPLILSTGMMVGFGLTTAVYLALANPAIWRSVWRMPAILGRQLKRPLFGLMLAGRLNRPLFVVAVALAGATMPTLIVGLVPIAYMLTLQRSMEPGRYQPIGWRSAPPLGLAFLGLSLVVASQPLGGGSNWWLVAGGVLLSLASVLAAALTSLDLAWGVDYAKKLKSATGRQDAEAASLVGTLMGAAVIAPGLFLAGLFLDSGETILKTLAVGLVIGVIVRTPFTVLLRKANFETTSLTINTIIFLSPLISLGLLAVFGYATGINLWLAVFGGLAIVVANLLLAVRRGQ